MGGLKHNPERLKLNLKIFRSLLDFYGPRNWWPARTRFEVIAGAVLAQSVAWENARKAVDNLRKNRMLNVSSLNEADAEDIAEKIRPSRFYNQKAEKLKTLCAYIRDEHQGSLSRMFGADDETLRSGLLSLKGIGRETADCILLYAGGKPSFVSDGYTSRFLSRYGILGKHSYEDARGYFMENLPRDVYIYKELHALIVCHCRRTCKTRPECGGCPVLFIDEKTFCAEGNSR